MLHDDPFEDRMKYDGTCWKCHGNPRLCDRESGECGALNNLQKEMTNMQPEVRRTTIYHCARCGADHVDMEFRRIKGVPIEDPDGTLWDWWGICPTTGDPVLQRDLKEPEPRVNGDRQE